MAHSELCGRFRWIVSGGILAVCLSWCGYIVLHRHVSAANCGEVLAVAPEFLDFGRVWEQTGFLWRLQIRTAASEAVNVIAMKSSCNCAFVEPKSFEVRVNKPASVDLRLNLHNRGGRTLSSWPFEAKLVAVTREAPPALSAWQVRGEVYQYPLHPSVARVYMRSLVVGSDFSPRTVVIECRRPVTALTARCEPQFSSVVVRPVHDSLSRYELRITPNKDLPVGEHTFSVYLKPTIDLAALPEGLGPPPELPIPVKAEVCHAVYASPSIITLGAMSLGETATETVMLYTLRDTDFSVTELQVQGCQSLAVKPDKGPGSHAQKYQVSQAVKALGPRTAEIRFLVRDGAEILPYVVAVPVTYHGVRSELLRSE